MVEDTGEEIKRKVKDAYPRASEDLKSFTATLTKWRYETAYEVFRQLDKLRYLCQNYLTCIKDVMGGGFQDSKLLEEIDTAINCNWLWIVIHVF